MEDLTKHQLILLTLLVSFVTSIASSIITFTLLQEAPVAVTQTINRVVERTIETVVPAENDGEPQVVREVQVVSEEDLVLESIEKSAASIVRIKTLGFDGTEIVTGLGIVLADGVVATDSRAVTSANASVLFPDGKVFGVAKTFTESGVTYLKIGKPANEVYSFHPIILGNSDALKLGQTVIAVSGKQSNAVSIGRVSQLQKSEAGAMSSVVSDISSSKTQTGSPLLNLSGEVVGLELPLSANDTILSYMPASTLKNGLKTALIELAK